MSPAAIKRIELPYRQKENPYPLVTISGDLILYRNGMIYFKTEPVKIEIEGQKTVVSFNVLLLGKDKAVLKMLFLQEFNLKIDWIIKEVEIRDTREWKQQQQTKLIWYQLGTMYTETKKALNSILKRYHKYKKLWNK